MDQLAVTYILGTVVTLAAAYFLIRIGVKHGTRGALREHEMWTRDGSLERAMDAHAAQMIERDDLARLEQRAAQREGA